MKLEIHWRDVHPSAAILARLQRGVGEHVRSRTLPRIRVVRVRAILTGEGEWVRCRIETELLGGRLRVAEAVSTDLLIATDVAVDRLSAMRGAPPVPARMPTARAA